MLNVIIGRPEGEVYETARYFDALFEEEWMNHDIIKDIIKDIDKSEMVSSRLIQNDTYGSFFPKDLSDGTKTLILMLNFPDMIFNGSQCGDNCCKWMIKVGELVSPIIAVHHIHKFSKDAEFEIRILNDNSIVRNSEEYFEKFLEVSMIINKVNFPRIGYKDTLGAELKERNSKPAPTRDKIIQWED